MRKIIYLATIFFLLMASVTPAIASPAAQPSQPEPNRLEANDKVFLPLTVNGVYGAFVTVQGRITSNQPTPAMVGSEAGFVDAGLGGVTITDAEGRTAVTQADGRFTITTRDKVKLEPSLSGYYFSPSYVQVNTAQGVNNVNFTGTNAQAAAAALAPDAEFFPNNSFEVVDYWNPISGSAAGYTPFYTSTDSNTGLWSGFTGIPYWWTTYQISWSRWRSHEILITAGHTAADLTMFFHPETEDVFLAADSKAPLQVDEPAQTDAAMQEALSALIGENADNEAALDFTDDVQYVAVINAVTNDFIAFPYAALNDSPASWFPIAIDLLPYANQLIKVEFGVFNDADGWETRAWWDDVSLNLETGAVTCSNILLNSNMEADTLDWSFINVPVMPVPPAFDATYFWSPLRSLRVGTPPTVADPAGSNLRASEAFQNFTIPANATYARLSMLILPQSTGWYGWWSDQAETMLAADGGMADTNSTNAPDMMEDQYAHITLPGGGEGYWLLFKYLSIDSSTWLAREYNMLPLAGIPLGVQFGTGNTMMNVSTSLYVDDVYLDVCVPDAAP